MNFVRLACWLKERGLVMRFLAIGGSPCFVEAKKVGLNPEKALKPSKYLAIAKGKELANRFEENRSQIIFFSFGADNDVLAWAKIFSRLKFRLVYIQQMQLGVSKKNIYQSWRFSKIDRWISPLKWLKMEVMEFTTFSSQKVREIPLGQDLERFAAFKESKAESRQKLNLPGEKILIGTMGRLDPAKGIDFLIECFSKLGQEFQNVELCVMGENTKEVKGDYGAFLRKLTDDLEIESRVHFLPFTEIPERFFKALDIFLLAARKETFGMVTVEAMASQTPIIAPDSGGSPELLAGHVGILYKERDGPEFILKLSKLLKDEEQRKTLSVKAKERALSQYSRKVVSDKILGLIEEIKS